MISPIEYNKAWSKTRLRSPEIWYTWKILEPYVKIASKRLEIGVGMFPKFSVRDTYFLDTSTHAIDELNKQGGKGIVMGVEEQLPFQRDFFDLVGAFEILEHLEKPERAIHEVAKTVKPGGLFILSVPMNPGYWSSWDVFAGHVQRFEPAPLNALLEKEGFAVDHCYVSWKLAKKRVFSWFMRLVGSLPLHFPNFFFSLYDHAVPAYTWFGRTFSKSRHYDSLLSIPQDSTAAMVVCRKLK
jgi:SAM-dependent methyltransferase